MTDEQHAAMHRLLAEHHQNLAKEAMLDVVQQYHADRRISTCAISAKCWRTSTTPRRLHGGARSRVGRRRDYRRLADG